MRTDNRLSRILHVLLHLRDMEAPATSELISRMLGTNPAVVRRTMAGLRQAGYVTSTKGHGGGWRLATQLDKITLLDLYNALGSPPLFAIGHANEDATCLLERAANKATADALAGAQAHFHDALAKVTVADLCTK